MAYLTSSSARVSSSITGYESLTTTSPGAFAAKISWPGPASIAFPFRELQTALSTPFDVSPTSFRRFLGFVTGRPTKGRCFTLRLIIDALATFDCVRRWDIRNGSFISNCNITIMVGSQEQVAVPARKGKHYTFSLRIPHTRVPVQERERNFYVQRSPYFI